MHAAHTLVQLALKALRLAGVGLLVLAYLYALRMSARATDPSVTTAKAGYPSGSTAVIASAAITGIAADN